MAVAGKEDHIDDKGYADPKEVPEDQTEKEGGGLAVELDAAKAHDQAFGGPGDEDRRRLVTDHPDRGDGQADGMERPPGEAVLHKGEEGHRHRADAEKEAADEDANIIFGSVIDQQMSDELKVTVIATGFDQADRGRIDNVHSLAVPKKELDIPTHTRNRWERDRLTKVPPPPAPTVNELVEAVDLPTFLRRGQ